LNQINKLTVEREGLHLFFEEYAPNSSGEITELEFREALFQMNVLISDSRFKRLFNHFDISKRGCLRYHEVYQICYPEEAQRQKELANKVGGRVKHTATAKHHKN